MNVSGADVAHQSKVADAVKACAADPAVGSFGDAVGQVASKTAAAVEVVASPEPSAGLLAMKLGQAELAENWKNKSALWDAEVHKSSTAGFKQDGRYYRGLRLSLGSLQGMAKTGMITTQQGTQNVSINATSEPNDAFVFALTGGFRGDLSKVNGPKDDYFSVMVEIDGVGTDLKFAWNTHGPSYASDRLYISEPVPPSKVTKLWLYDQAAQKFRDFTDEWKSWT